MVQAFNKIGVNLAAFGQHDFDYGLAQTLQNVKLSQFPWVASNLQLPRTATQPARPLLGTENTAIVREVGGVKIGYLGLTLGMETTSAKDSVFQSDYLQAAQVAVERLQKAGAEVIVALAQFPLEKDGLALLNAVPEIDLVLREEESFAQEGNRVTQLPDGRLIIAPEGNYGSVARVDFSRDDSGKWKFSTREIQVDASVAPSERGLKLQEHYLAQQAQLLNQEIACLDREYQRPLPLGLISATAFRDAVQADLGWINAGGLRADLASGKVTKAQALAVHPFDNKVMKIETTGAQLKQALAQGAASAPAGNSGGYPLLAGASFKFDPQAAPGAQISDLRWSDGTLIRETDRFTLALTNYVFNGGNGVTALQNARVLIDAGYAGSDFDALQQHLAKNFSCTQLANKHDADPAVPKLEPKAEDENPAQPSPDLRHLEKDSEAVSVKTNLKNSPANLANTGSDLIYVILFSIFALFGGLKSVNFAKREAKNS